MNKIFSDKKSLVVLTENWISRGVHTLHFPTTIASKSNQNDTLERFVFFLDSARLQDPPKVHHGTDRFNRLAPIGGFWVSFLTPFDFEGGPKIEIFGIEANKMMKRRVRERCECILTKLFSKLRSGAIYQPSIASKRICYTFLFSVGRVGASVIVKTKGPLVWAKGRIHIYATIPKIQSPGDRGTKELKYARKMETHTSNKWTAR